MAGSPTALWRRGLGRTALGTSPRHPPTATTPRAEGAGAGEGPCAGTLLPVPQGRVHDLPVEPGQQGDHGMVEEGVRFEPRASCGLGSCLGSGLGSGNDGVGHSSGEGLALEAAVGRRGEGLTSPRWLWPPRSDNTQGGRSARRGGSVKVARAASAATRERRACEAQARSRLGALGLQGTPLSHCKYSLSIVNHYDTKNPPQVV